MSVRPAVLGPLRGLVRWGCTGSACPIYTDWQCASSPARPDRSSWFAGIHLKSPNANRWLCLPGNQRPVRSAARRLGITGKVKGSAECGLSRPRKRGGAEVVRSSHLTAAPEGNQRCGVVSTRSLGSPSDRGAPGISGGRKGPRYVWSMEETGNDRLATD